MGEGTEINAHDNGRETYFQCGENTEIIVGQDCLFSNSIMVCTTDFHRVYDEERAILNQNRSVRIGKHVWVGQKAYICKGVELGDNVVVGACSVVTKSFAHGNCVIVGNPGSIRKDNIQWEM